MSEDAQRQASGEEEHQKLKLLGLDRSAPPPPATQKGAPLRPWTLPNLVGAMRIALMPVFVWAALETNDGTGIWIGFFYAALAWSDYLDGFLARVTGQYSRLGTLLDPIADRLLVLAGIVVCWNFETLPRWALVVFAARELCMLVLGQFAVRHGVQVAVNWPGRISVWPTFSGIFFALLGVPWLAVPLFLLGLLLALIATVGYVQSSVSQLRAARKTSPKPSS